MFDLLILPMLSFLALLGYYRMGRRWWLLPYYGILLVLASHWLSQRGSFDSIEVWCFLCFPGWSALFVDGASSLSHTRLPLFRRRRALRRAFQALAEERELPSDTVRSTSFSIKEPAYDLELAFQVTESGPALTMTWHSEALPEDLRLSPADTAKIRAASLKRAVCSPLFFLRDGAVPAFTDLHGELEAEVAFLWTGLSKLAIRGDEATVFGLFSPQTCVLFRALLEDEVPAQVRMQDQVLELRWYHLSDDVAFLSSCLSRGERIFEALRSNIYPAYADISYSLPHRLFVQAKAALPVPVPEDVIEYASLARFADWGQKHPLAYRIRCLELLLGRFPESEPAQQARDWACLHERMVFRLLGVFSLDDEDAIPHLKSMWAAHRDDLVAKPPMQMVVRELAIRLPQEQALSFIAEVAAVEVPAMLLLVLPVIAKRKLQESLPLFVRPITSLSQWRTQDAIDQETFLGWIEPYIRAIGSLGDGEGWATSGLEAPLLGTLRAPLDSSSVLLLRLLSAWGTSAALPTLCDLCDALGGEQKASVEQVITNIKYRMGATDAGQLSMVAPAEDEGQLSLSHETGQLSLSHLEGRLSRPLDVGGALHLVDLTSEQAAPGAHKQ